MEINTHHHIADCRCLSLVELKKTMRVLESRAKEIMTQIEFKVLGQTMQRVTIYFGLFLSTWAISMTLAVDSGSITSMIPAMLGIPIAVLGFMATRFPSKLKLIMHIVVLLGLIVLLGGLDFLRGIGSEGGPFSNPLAGASKLMMLITGVGFTVLCIKSFLFAREQRAQ